MSWKDLGRTLPLLTAHVQRVMGAAAANAFSRRARHSSRDAKQLHGSELGCGKLEAARGYAFYALHEQVSSQYQGMANCQCTSPVPQSDRRSRLSAARSPGVQLHEPRLQGRTDHTGQLCDERESTHCRRQLRLWPSSHRVSQAGSKSPRLLQ